MNVNAHQWGTLIGTGISALFVGIDFSIVNTALADIQNALHANLSDLQWVMAGFGLTFCTFLIAMGRLGDLLGRRLMLYIGICGFILSSLGSGLSETSFQLIIFRIFQGTFSAIVIPCGMALTSNVFPKNEQGKAIGLFTSILGIGFAIGPVLGGILVGFASWRWIFLINLPVGIISLTVCVLSLNESKVLKPVKIDWLGMSLITIALATAVFAITQGSNFGWESFVILSSFIIAFLAFCILMWVESKRTNPLIPFQLLNNKSFFLGILLFIVTLGFSWTVAFFTPLYLVTVLKLGPEATGFMLLIMTTMTFVVPGIAGTLYDRKGKKISIYLVFALSLISFILMSFFSLKGPIWLIAFAFIAYGSAWGAANGVAMPICFSEQKTSEDSGLISGVATTLFNIFGLLLFSIFGTLFSYIEETRIFFYLKKDHYQLSHHQIKSLQAVVTQHPEKLQTLFSKFSPHLIDQMNLILRESFVEAFRFIMIIMLIIVIICWFLVLPSLKKLNRL